MPTLKPLPDIEGPKLECFTQEITAHDIEFLPVIYDDSAGHSLITSVRIDGREYCLQLASVQRYNSIFHPATRVADLISSLFGLISSPRSRRWIIMIYTILMTADGVPWGS